MNDKKRREGEPSLFDEDAFSTDEAAKVFAAWNALPDPFLKSHKLTAKRRASLNQRLKERFFRKNWRDALARVKASAFCRGSNDRVWIADFEWFISPDAVVKIMEGKYDDRKRGLTANDHSKGF